MQRLRNIIKPITGFIKSLPLKIRNAWEFFHSSFTKKKKIVEAILKTFWIWLRGKISILLYNLNHPVFYSFTITIAVVLLHRVISPLIKSQDILITNMQNFIEWAGVLYSLLVSMILVRSWERLEYTGSILANEAYALSCLSDNVKLISKLSTKALSPDIDKITILIKEYIHHVDEQFEIEHDDITKELIGDEKISIIKQYVETMIKLNPTLTELNLSQTLEDVIKARKKRLLNSKIRIPFPIFILLFISSLLWLSLFVSVDFDNIWINYALVGGLTFVVITITLTILFFYQPINIYWNDLSGAWKKLKSKI